jgi:ABC-type polysaccharide/polyol phosphate export permease
MAVRIYFMGFLYGHLFKIDISQYFPFLAAGLIVWTTLATLINESTIIFIQSESYLRNIKIAYVHLVIRVIVRNIIIFLHNILAYIPIIIYFGSSMHNFHAINMLYFIPNLILLFVNCILIGTSLAILGTRFRDLPLIVDSVVQVVFFITPIMWMPNLLPEAYQWLVWYNPCYHVVNLVRAPLLGVQIEPISYMVLAGITVLSFSMFYYLMNRCKHRIIFWL